jgi:hypothetical protein
MATAWKVAAATAVIRWLVAPVIAHFLPKVMSYLVVDPSEKLRDLKIRILPELEKTLHKVDVARMMREPDRARERASDLSALSDMAAWLRHAREDAEDILDDALEIDLYRSNCWQRLCGAAATCTSSCASVALRPHDYKQQRCGYCSGPGQSTTASTAVGSTALCRAPCGSHCSGRGRSSIVLW